MKGVVLAGGKGTRLGNLTRVTNKHLLPVGDRPMIQHCVEKLVGAGIVDILIVTGGEHIGHIAEFLGSGRDFDCRMTYKVQDEAGGIAQALALAEGFIQPDETMCVILGDNIFEEPIKPHADSYLKERCRDRWDQSGDHLKSGYAMVMLKDVPDPSRFGVAEVELRYGECVRLVSNDQDVQVSRVFFGGPMHGIPHVLSIEEKPDDPKSNFAVTGIYFYDHTVFDIIDALKPSDRGELEITDVNNAYLMAGRLGCGFWNGWWTDAGQPDSYARANALIREGA